LRVKALSGQKSRHWTRPGGAAWLVWFEGTVTYHCIGTVFPDYPAVASFKIGVVGRGLPGAASLRIQFGDRGLIEIMAIQFSLAHLTVLGCAPPEATYIAAQAGYDFVSLRIIMMGASNEAGDYSLAANPAMLRQTKAALLETGMRVHDIELAHIHDRLDTRSWLPALEVGAELGVRHVISSIWTRNRSFAIERFAELCDLARPLGLMVDLEFVSFADVANLRDAVDVIRTANRVNSGLLLDTLHFHCSRVRLDELDAVPAEWFQFMHLCDGPKEIPATKEGLIHTAREERLYPGEGGIQIAAILNRLPDMTYSIELPNAARARELGYAQHALRCLQTSRQYLSAHPREQESLLSKIGQD
jgi:sugar phosphate isomerase/epimerase